MARKSLSLFFGIFLAVLLLGSSLVNASYYNNYGYGGNYGYENYYDPYDYRHSYGNSYRNNYRPNLVSISSKNRYDDGWVYRSRDSSYRSYNSYYPGYSGVKTRDREYVLNRYYPYYSYVRDNSYKESSGHYSYSQHSESNKRLLARPEHYMYLWSYR